MTQLNSRRASRLILADGQLRVLRLRHAGANGESFWAPPGGGLKNGETFEQAAKREAREELGLTSLTLRRAWDRTTNFIYIDQPVRQHEWYFQVEGQLPASSPTVAKVHKREGILEVRWWTIPEIESTTETVFPENLPSALRSLAN